MNESNESLPLRELLKVKNEEKRRLKEEFNKIQDDFDYYKSELNKLEDDREELQKKMKTSDKPEVMISKLKALKHRQANDKLTP